MVLPRSTTVELGRSQGKDSITKVVRAGSKMGAILTARVDAIGEVPLRSQEVGVVNNLGTNRFFNKWEVEIRDTQELENIGK